jgi:LPPG:FO 2-phospho-L-lactate transferase
MTPSQSWTACDLAWCLERARMLIEGLPPTAALGRLNEAIGVRTHVLPMSDDPVRTWVRSGAGWCSFQEFLIRKHAEGIVEGLEFRGAEQAQPSEQVLAALAGARAIVIGPSNPLASIAPILAVPGIREALAEAPAPVVAVSPVVGGKILKGPTAAFMAFAALECNADGVADFYGELLDGIVADENVARLPTIQIDTRMDDPSARARVARQTLDFAEALAE